MALKQKRMHLPDQQAQRRRGPRVWLGEAPDDAGSQRLQLGAGAGGSAAVARALFHRLPVVRDQREDVHAARV